MKSINLSSHNLENALVCPTSKSYANRALILAALDKRVITIKDLPESEDVKFMLEGLEELGIKLNRSDKQVEVIGNIDDVDPSRSIYLGEGGTTIRFFMALVSTLSVPIKLKVNSRFLKRPIDEFIEVFNKLGVSVKLEDCSIHVQGPILQNQKIEVDCLKSTQFASALELISDKVNLEVVTKNLEASSSYFKMTKAVLTELNESNVYSVPVDYSSFGYFAAFSALTSPVKIKNAYSIDPLQGDSQILEFIKQMGGDYQFTSEGVCVLPIKEFKSIVVDGSGCIDLVPTLMVLMGLSGKEQKLINIKNLRYKECDRLAEMQRLLTIFKIPFLYDEREDVFTIKGIRPRLEQHKVEAAYDHRMVMCAAMMVKLFGGGDVSPVEAVDKSFGTFFEYFK